MTNFSYNRIYKKIFKAYTTYRKYKEGDSFMIKLIVSDLDGTIIDHHHMIAKENLKAINDLQKSHLPFVICTGKTYAISKSFCQDFHAQFGIFGNGSEIINLKTGEEIDKKTLSLSAIQSCLSIASAHHLHVHAYTTDSILTQNLLYLDLRNALLFPNQIYIQKVDDLQTFIKKEKPDILKIVLSSESDLSIVKAELESQTNLSICYIHKYGHYKDQIIHKEYGYLDISPPLVSKGSALKTLSHYLQINKEEILSVGDNLNDLDMLQNSGIGIAVASAYEEVKQVATYTTTCSVENGAFAEAVYRFIPFESNNNLT